MKNTNDKGLKKFKGETISLPIVDLVALNPRRYNFNNLTLGDMKKNNQTWERVSKVVV